MTLNDLEWSFCVKIWLELNIEWVGVLAFGEKLLGNLQSYTHRLSAAKNGAPHCTRDISVMGLFTGGPKEEASNQSTVYSHSQFSRMLFTDIEKSKITMVEFGSKQNMTDMDTKRVRGKCIANALVCQLC